MRSTIIQMHKAQTGAVTDSSSPWSDTDSPSASNGNPHHGWTTAQKPVATPNERQRPGRDEPGGDTEGVEAHVLPHLGDEHEAGEREGERGPHAPAYRLVPDEPSPERDEHRRGELEQ